MKATKIFSRFCLFLVSVGLFWGSSTGSVLAQEVVEESSDLAAVEQTMTPHVFTRAKVISITEEGINEQAGFSDAYQTVLLQILAGDEAGKVITTDYVMAAPSFERQKLSVNDLVIVAKVNDSVGIGYQIIDVYRLPAVMIIAVLFVVLAMVFGRRQGTMAVFGLGVSVLILGMVVAPRIIAGDDPVLVSALGAVAIAVCSMLLAHGLNKRSGLALSATLLTLGLGFVLSALALAFANLSGSGTEEAAFLQLSYLPNLDLRGLLLAGIVIGTLGVLDDVTTAQVASIEEIQDAARGQLHRLELYRRGLSVGREHIASLVNTLALAYVGTAFPVFLLFLLPGSPPLWVVLNGEYVMEEVVRALVGGAALMLAVPISTLFGAWVFGRKE